MDRRAQTTFDFAVGITLFLLVVGFAFTAVPGLLAPYQGSGEGEAILSDRVADHLATDRLAGEERFELENDSVKSLFNATLDDSLKADLGVAERYGLNVTLDLDSGLCPGELAGDPTPDRCELGGSPPDRATLARSSRTVLVDGVRADLTVRVWG